MTNEFIRDQNARSDVSVAYWKPGMRKHTSVPGKNPSDAGFNSWVAEEVRRAPEGMIIFFITTTTDIF